MGIETGASPYPVELVPPDIAPHRAGNSGVEYVWSFESAVPGPHVMVNAVTHGNELCGAIAVDRLLREGLRPVRGKLTLAFANVAAYKKFDAAKPHANRFVDEDFNRVWSASVLDGPRESVELNRARELRPLIDTVDYLFDIHSMHDPHGPLMLSGLLAKGIALAKAVGVPEHIVADAGHANGTRLRDYAGFGDPSSPKTALLIECGQHWERAAADLAWQSTWRFLLALDVVNRTRALREIGMAAPRQHVVRVTDALIASSVDYQFAPGLKGLSVVKYKGDLIATDAGAAIIAPYDDCVLVMPTLAHVKPGLTVVRIGRLES
jgi:hypothetical protein